MTDTPLYQSTMASYTAQLRTLFAPAETEAGTTSRGGGALTPEAVAAGAATLAATLRQAGELNVSYLDVGSRAEQEAAELKLLEQASAEFKIARQLLELAGQQAGSSGDTAARSGDTAEIQASIDELISMLERPLDVVGMAGMARGAEDRPKESAPARADLQQEVEASLQSICRQAGRVGGQAVQALLLLDAQTLKKGVSLISKDVWNTVDSIVAGVGKVVRQVIEAAVHLLLQAYDWVLALLGKDVEAKARTQVRDWLEEIKKEKPDGDGPGLAERLVTWLYGPDAIKTEIAAWIQTSQAGVEPVNQAAEAILSLRQRYTTKTDQVRKFLNLVALARAIPFVSKAPQLQVLVAAVTLGLLGYILYTGYDYVDSGRVAFFNRFGIGIPDRVEGVRKTVQKALGAA